MKIILNTPVEHDGKTYTDLTLREADTGDLMAADHFQGQTSKIAAILASMAEMPLPAFRKIKASDFKRIMEEAAELMGEPARATNGGSSSP